jgi:hypothetical protein
MGFIDHRRAPLPRMPSARCVRACVRASITAPVQPHRSENLTAEA